MLVAVVLEPSWASESPVCLPPELPVISHRRPGAAAGWGPHLENQGIWELNRRKGAVDSGRSKISIIMSPDLRLEPAGQKEGSGQAAGAQ